MKKLKTLLIFVLLITCIVVLTSCTGEGGGTAPTTITEETPIEDFISVTKSIYLTEENRTGELEDRSITIQQLRSSVPVITSRDYGILFLKTSTKFTLTSISFKVIASEDYTTGFYINIDFVQTINLKANISQEVNIIVPNGELELQRGSFKIIKTSSSKVKNIQLYDLKINGR